MKKVSQVAVKTNLSVCLPGDVILVDREDAEGLCDVYIYAGRYDNRPTGVCLREYGKKSEIMGYSLYGLTRLVAESFAGWVVFENLPMRSTPAPKDNVIFVRGIPVPPLTFLKAMYPSISLEMVEFSKFEGSMFRDEEGESYNIDEHLWDGFMDRNRIMQCWVDAAEGYLR